MADTTTLDPQATVDEPDVLKRKPVPPIADTAPTDALSIVQQSLREQPRREQAEREASEAASKARKAAAKVQAENAVAAIEEEKRFQADTDAIRAQAQQRAPIAPTIPPAPSRALHGFLAPTKDESPETSIAKLIQGIGLMGQLVGGGKLGARASLAALSGAIEGWRVGDTERANRHFADWKAETQRLLDQWQNEREEYEAWYKPNVTLNLEQRARALKLSALARQQAEIAKTAEANDLEQVLKDIQHRNEHAEKVEQNRANLLRMHEDAAARRDQAQRFMDMKLEFERERIDLQKQRLQQMLQPPQIAPQDMEHLMDLYEATPHPSSDMFKGWGPQATQLFNLVQTNALARAYARGDNAAVIVLRRKNLEINTATAKDLTKIQARFNSDVSRFDQTVQRVKGLINAVPETGMPIVNKWLRRSAYEFAGDPDVKAFNDQMEILALDIALVTTRAKQQSTVSLQNHARELLSTAQTKEDLLKAIDTVFIPDSQIAKATLEQERQKLQDALRQGVMYDQPGAATPKPSPGGKVIWKLRESKTGRVREYEPSEAEIRDNKPDRAGYELVR